MAYEYCPVACDVITCERVGYDPECRQHSPGLLTFDFGRGEFSFKATLATGSIPCADIYCLRHKLKELLRMHYGSK